MKGDEISRLQHLHHPRLRIRVPPGGPMERQTAADSERQGTRLLLRKRLFRSRRPEDALKSHLGVARR